MKSNNRRRRVFEIATIALACLCIGLIVFGYEQDRRVRALTIQVNSAFQKAFYESIELLSGVQLNLEKLLVSGSESQEQSLLNAISRQAEGAQSNLSVMPESHESVSGALKFVNQTSDFARVLSEKLGTGAQLTSDDLTQIGVLHKTCVSLNESLLDVMAQFERGEIVFSTELVANPKSMQQPSEPAVDYPVLLYDGPFSDASVSNVFKAVKGSYLTPQQAEQKLIDYIGRERVKQISYQGESTVTAPCYDFIIETEAGALDASVTQQGGEVLYILPERGETIQTLSMAECIDLASSFLQRNGYGPMYVSYWRQLDGLVTINFAAVQDGVLLYPDLVKVQVSMRTGLVVGIEAGNYLRNHITRTLATPTLSIEDALRRINDALIVDHTRLCVIPLINNETLCYEATAYMENGDRFLIYIDAQTGQEVTILRVTQNSEGFITQ